MALTHTTGASENISGRFQRYDGASELAVARVGFGADFASVAAEVGVSESALVARFCNWPAADGNVEQQVRLPPNSQQIFKSLANGDQVRFGDTITYTLTTGNYFELSEQQQLAIPLGDDAYDEL